MLKDEQVSKRVHNYMAILPDILQELVPEISTLKDGLVIEHHICIKNPSMKQIILSNCLHIYYIE